MDRVELHVGPVGSPEKGGEQTIVIKCDIASDYANTLVTFILVMHAEQTDVFGRDCVFWHPCDFSVGHDWCLNQQLVAGALHASSTQPLVSASAMFSKLHKIANIYI